LAAERGYRYIHSGDEPHLIAGVGTHTLELLEERPDIEVVIVPIGGGSGAAGACIVAKARGAGIEVIGVQSAQAPTAHDSWRERRLVERPNTTVAEGLSTRTAFELPQRILRELLDDFVLVSDESILQAVALMIEKTRTLVEPAGAAPLAALMSPALRDRLQGRRVALICSGANISPAQLRAVLAQSPEASGR
jgi:threonine dehydratase